MYVRALISSEEKQRRILMSLDWYSILGVNADATQSEIRSAFKTMALRTHPDKLVSRSPSTSAETTNAPQPVSFVDVRRAAGVLLDPLQRAIFDGLRVHRIVRTDGRISSTLCDADVDHVVYDRDTDTYWAIVECRCGGEYRVLLTSAPRGGRYVCECETCSLVVELSMSEEGTLAAIHGAA